MIAEYYELNKGRQNNQAFSSQIVYAIYCRNIMNLTEN